MARMQLARATALIAVIFIVVLSAGYAASERNAAADPALRAAQKSS